MRSWTLVVLLACLPMIATAESRHSIKVINDTRNRIVAFAIAPTGSSRWINVDFGDRPFDSQLAVMLEWHDDDVCLRDFRAMLSDGRMIVAQGFDVCRLHVYRPGFWFYNGRQGGMRLP
ncbi:hypothetical protein GCM10007862_19530 [Dyella lipolytica]|uniref:Uncharacterized protein n=1 Tax=Dyella lipolytica TaxID=1867835 RepID=A0ABW8IV94_9GAMM|nr:hypothetical protein [Dyella lipolytica]GLQ46902.1 hypothetical protein GCM10007862_19530 [Dyella lipolytica]